VKAFEFVPEYEATKARMSAEGKALDEAARAFKATGRRDREKYEIAIAAQAKYNETAKQLRALEVAERDRMVRILALPNEMRGNPDDVVIPGYNASYRKSVTEASSLVAMLVHRDIMPTGVKVNGVRGKRAYYQNAIRAIHINKDTSVSVIVHEIVHDIEYSHPDVSRKTKAFLAKRANGEQPKPLRVLTGNKAFGRTEIAYEDEWKKRGGSHYMGKVYDRASTELLTMGIERMLADAKSFAEKDPEYFRFMLEILRRVG
jgi:predicted secreted Zn-dependent protease